MGIKLTAKTDIGMRTRKGDTKFMQVMRVIDRGRNWELVISHSQSSFIRKEHFDLEVL